MAIRRWRRGDENQKMEKRLWQSEDGGEAMGIKRWRRGDGNHKMAIRPWQSRVGCEGVPSRTRNIIELSASDNSDT
jgi:hypothetical protein